MTSLSYIAESLPWTIAGLLVGYFMARSTVALETVAESVQEGDTVSEHEPRSMRKRRFTVTHIVGAVLVLLGIWTAVQGYLQGQRTERLSECQTAYSNGFADALDARSRATAEAQDASDEFFFTIARVGPSPEGREQMRKAFDAYVAKRAEAKKTQAEHPFPDPPRDVCK